MSTMMQRKRVLAYIAPAAVIILLVMGTVWAQASGPGLDRAVGAQTAVGTAFTYQGRLDKSGSAVTDTCAFQFSLYDTASGGSQVGSTVTKSSVSVTDGLFTTELDFGSSAFDGNARYLQIAVKCTGESSYTTLNGRVALNPAPYALSLRPGAVISGTTGTMLTGWSETETSAAVGLYGYAKSSNYAAYGVEGAADGTGTGVYGQAPYEGVAGLASASTGASYGVTGTSDSSSGTGVKGYARASSGTTYGVYGQAQSSSGYGVYGTAPSNGVYGEGSSLTGATYGVYGKSLSASGYGVYGDNIASTGTPYGVYGIASSTGSATSYGVYGKSNSSVGTGVGGIAPTNGVYGEASNSSGSTWGVYGKSSSADGYGVYGTNANTNGAGVRGETVNGNGVEGVVDWTNSGTGVGVYGAGGFYGSAARLENANTGIPAVTIQNLGGGSSPALVVTGTTHLEGAVTWKPITSSLSLPAAAFNPNSGGYTFTNNGHTLTPGNVSSTLYLTPVQLPQGATVTRVTFYWTDSSINSNGSASLYRIDMAGSESLMALTATTGSSGTPSSSSTTAILNSSIDNSLYGYYVWLSLPVNNGTVVAHGVIVEYTIDQPY
ncbi:MAG: hypothetical protein ACE5E7_11975 [Anaerolineae bacterium]